jgi:hypothetical protein
MSGTTPSFDASASVLGYLYQCRYALLLALQHDEDPSLQMSIEKLDDLAFSDGDHAGLDPTELLQFKHHIKRAGGLSDKSLDIWKTLRIWSELILSKKVDVDHTVFIMLTTSISGKKNAVHHLLDDTSLRDHNEALLLLEQAGKGSKSKVVCDAFSTFMRLPVMLRRKMFERVHLMEGSPDILKVRKEIETTIRHAVRPQHRSAFIERLEGWWFGVVIEHLMSSTPQSTIAVASVHQRVHDLREQFQRDALPDDFLQAPIPTEVVPQDDQRMFIRQLHLVQVTSNRIRTAQEDHYRAFAQRSRWVRDNLVDLPEVGKFEARLIDEWKHMYEIMQEGIPTDADERRLANAGKQLYDWTQEHAPANAALFIRPQFPASYMVRGSYHMLADKFRVGWHPHYEVRLVSGEKRAKETGNVK